MDQIVEITKDVFGPKLSIITVWDTCPISHDQASEMPFARDLEEMDQDLSTVEDVVWTIIGVDPDVIVTRATLDFNAPEVMRLLPRDLQDRVIIYNPNAAMGWHHPAFQKVWRSAGFTRGAANVEDLRHELRKLL
jgi:hypothetical protein